MKVFSRWPNSEICFKDYNSKLLVKGLKLPCKLSILTHRVSVQKSWFNVLLVHDKGAQY